VQSAVRATGPRRHRGRSQCRSAAGVECRGRRPPGARPAVRVGTRPDGGSMLVVQSEFAGIEHSLRALRVGLDAEVVGQQWIPFGPCCRHGPGGWTGSAGSGPVGAMSNWWSSGRTNDERSRTARGAGDTQRPGDGAGSGAHRAARRQRGGIRSLHGGHLRVPAQQGISVVRHQPSAALPGARRVSSAVGVATFDRSSSTPSDESPAGLRSDRCARLVFHGKPAQGGDDRVRAGGADFYALLNAPFPGGPTFRRGACPAFALAASRCAACSAAWLSPRVALHLSPCEGKRRNRSRVPADSIVHLAAGKGVRFAVPLASTAARGRRLVCRSAAVHLGFCVTTACCWHFWRCSVFSSWGSLCPIPHTTKSSKRTAPVSRSRSVLPHHR
jgi:hypothetical protein